MSTSTELTPEQRANWEKLIEALRSRRYHQGQQYLRQEAFHPDEPELFCCLGVACEVLNVPRANSGYSFHFEHLEGSWEKNDVPHRSWWNTHFGYLISRSQLTEMNDQGQSFSEIADFIQAALHQLDHELMEPPNA